MTIPLDSGGRECSQIFRQTIPIEEARTVLLPTKFVRYTGNGQVEDVKAQAVNPAELPKFQSLPYLPKTSSAPNICRRVKRFEDIF